MVAVIQRQGLHLETQPEPESLGRVHKTPWLGVRNQGLELGLQSPLGVLNSKPKVPTMIFQTTNQESGYPFDGNNNKLPFIVLGMKYEIQNRVGVSIFFLMA